MSQNEGGEKEILEEEDERDGEEEEGDHLTLESRSGRLFLKSAMDKSMKGTR